MNSFEERLDSERPKGFVYSKEFGGPNWLDNRETASAFLNKDPAVLVVGAGQAGLSIAARLGQLNVDTLVIDKADRIGDNWRNRYHRLSLHNQTHVNHLPYMQFPPNWPAYIPKDKLVVITGLSGSGKSSLAFDTIYAEGQRRYVESLSAYARQFLGLMEKPDVDYIEGLSPAISIEQKTSSRNPRSTVGTITEIYDYLRLLFARIGNQHCYSCGGDVERQTVQQIVDNILSFEKESKFNLY